LRDCFFYELFDVVPKSGEKLGRKIELDIAGLEEFWKGSLGA
jgi:hypothetical protein